MSHGFPCPNPTCSHTFPPEAVRGAAALTCPRCGHSFQFRPGPAAPAQPPAAPKPARAPAPAPRPAPARTPPPATAAPPKPPPTAAAVAPPARPAAAPTAPTVPLALPVGPAEATATAPLAPPPDYTPPRLARHQPRKKGGVAKYVLLALAVLLVPTLGVTGWLLRGWLSRLGPLTNTEQPSGPAYNSTLYNFSFRYPPPPWRQDERLRLDLRTGVALRRTDPNGWLAILTADYKERTPPDAEMIDEGVRRLKGYFKDSFEWEQKPDTQFAGHRAQRLEFVGDVNSVEMTGDCVMLAYNGIGYWVLTWGPTATHDVIADQWDAVRGGFALGKEREGWAQKPPRQLVLTGTKLPYTLRYLEGIWEKQDDPSAYDADADSALLGHDQAEPKDTDKNGTAVVLLLPKQDDLKAAVKAARDHVLAQEKKLYPDCTVEDADAKAAGADRPPDRVGNKDGRIVKLHVKNPDALEHFVYLAVVQQPDQVLAIQCECDWRRKVYWEVNFNQLVREFKLAK